MQSGQAQLVSIFLFHGWFLTWSSSLPAKESTACMYVCVCARMHVCMWGNFDKLKAQIEWHWKNLINIRYIPNAEYASDPIIHIRLHRALLL